MNKHINLHIEGTEHDTQPVEVEYVSPDIYRVLFSPGFVEDIAAGDLIKVTDEKRGKFEVIEYGGNVSVKISDVIGIVDNLQSMDKILSLVGARRDGNQEHVAVWTIPVKSGFPKIEDAIGKACELLQDPTWWYGNVYDSQNNPLNWWQ